MNYTTGIGLPNLVQVQKSKIYACGCRLNILIAGSHGTGKTTFLNNFFSTSKFIYDPAFSNSSEKYQYLNSSMNIQITEAEVNENGFVSHITTIEVDGIGDGISNKSNSQCITDMIKQRYEEHSKNNASFTHCTLNDHRIHLCLYLLEPSPVVRDVDIECMQHISSYCNLIPVISKADFATKKMVEQIKREVKQQLDENNILTFQECAPYSIVMTSCSNPEEIDLRVYPWGELCVSALQINEFQHLRAFILKESISALYEETNSFYDKFRLLRLSGISSQIKGKGENAILELIEKNQREINEMKERIKQKKEQLKNK